MSDPAAMGIWTDRKDKRKYVAIRDERDILTIPASTREMQDDSMVSETGIWTAEAFAKRFQR